MKRLLANKTKFVPHLVALGFFPFIVMSGPLFAQTTGAVDPRPAVEPSVKNDDLPPGGCMPIGLTASGEVVFPFQCKEFIERMKGINRKASAPEEKPATAEEGSAAGHNSSIPPTIDVTRTQEPAAAEEKAVAKQEGSVAPENSKPADQPVEKAPLQKRVEQEPRERAIGPPGCTHFKTYDPVSRTYRSYDGRRLQCR